MPLLILFCITGAEATLKNKMPSKHLERFQQDTNAKEAAFPNTFILQDKTPEKILYLTFDDGPDRQITPEILTILKAEGVKATFFFLGARMATETEMLKQTISQGHLVLPHGYSHRDFRKRDAKGIYEEEILASEKLIEDAGGNVPKMFRPPYGAVTEAQIRFFKAKGYRIINWSVDSFDWQKGAKVRPVVDEVVKTAHPGAIILMHSGSANHASPAALKKILRVLKEKGFAFKRIDTMTRFSN